MLNITNWLTTLLPFSTVMADKLIWLEVEILTETNIRKHQASVAHQRDLLSGGQWLQISSKQNRRGLFTSYDFLRKTLPAARRAVFDHIRTR